MCGLLQGMPRAASVLIDMNRTPIVSSEQKITKTATATSREVLCIQKVYKHCDMSEAEYWVLLASVVRPAVSKEPIYWRHRASEMKMYSFAFPSPALPTKGGMELETGVCTGLHCHCRRLFSAVLCIHD